MTELAADTQNRAEEPFADAAQDSPAVDTDPERALADFPLRVDDDTLREVVDDEWSLERIRFSLTKKLATAHSPAARARLFGLRAVTGRLLNKLNDALDDAEEALRCAEATGSARRIAVASTRLARVLQWRGDFTVADAMYQRALEAPIPNRLRAEIHYYFGTSCYDQGRLIEALQHFEKVLELQPEPSQTQVVTAFRAFSALQKKAEKEGFGPLPRTRAEILQETPLPEVRYHEVFRRYGYVAADGEVAIPPTFREAYPFAGDVAWAQPDDSSGWVLLSPSGETLISATEYLAVGPFSEGLAWVLSDPVVGWYAIDTHGVVVVPPAGYTDARPFHAGLAAVQRNGRWGAVDTQGREVVPMEYDAFRTASSESAYLSGFTSEGLAVVEQNGLHGVINRSGDVVVPFEYQQIEIHPVGFLVRPPIQEPDYSNPFRTKVNLTDGFGALDRRGELVVEPVHPNREAVLQELEKLMKDAHPIL